MKNYLVLVLFVSGLACSEDKELNSLCQQNNELIYHIQQKHPADESVCGKCVNQILNRIPKDEKFMALVNSCGLVACEHDGFEDCACVLRETESCKDVAKRFYQASTVCNAVCFKDYQ